MIQIRCFDAEHELDLEDEVNEFLSELNDEDIINVFYSSSHMMDRESPMYSFSACVLFRIKSQNKAKLSLGRKKS